MKRKLIIFGDSAFAEVAFELFTHDSEYEVCAFTVSEKFLTKNELFGIPIVPFEDIQKQYPSGQYSMFIALVYNRLNRLRAQFFHEAKQKGYQLATYISSRAFVWRNARVGENTFIFENNVVQPFAKVGSNVVMWSGNHLGHHSSIGDHTFLSSHVVISGFCSLGTHGFYGVNATVGNNVTIGNDCFLGANALVVRSIPDGSFVKAAADTPEARTTYEKFDVEDSESR